MTVHLLNALERLRGSVLSLAALTEEQLRQGVEALISRDKKLARAVQENDSLVDQREVDLEEECLQMLALYQPVAHDLRFIVSVLKANSDLERIGDYACSIAERAEFLSEHPIPEEPIDFSAMAQHVRKMLNGCVDAFVKQDVELARSICQSDKLVNEIHSSNFKLVENCIVRHPKYVAEFIQLLSVSRYLERVADLSTNIAEDVIYMVGGKIIRHKKA